MNNKFFDASRRSFLNKGTLATFSIGLGGSLAGTSLLSACGGESKSQQDAKVDLITGFEQTPLAYDYSALEPHIDAETMEIHYTKHAAGYAKNLKEACEKEGVDMDKPLEELMVNMSNYSTAMRNNGGGHYNHELFWKIMSPDGGGGPSGKISEAINGRFGSFEAFKEEFENAAKTRFGSGWAWLVLNNNGELAIGSTPNQDNPMMDLSEFRGSPLIGIDVWEHAYYLKYQNERPKYISNWWNLLNWEKVAERYEALS
ncbi:superoxide dismutase [Pararhodonellum marinum]|uniref:superoxide dismutase n=1 Tax=Pararhodonellum marinum TaxID=2755358 RepID=UPI00188DCA0A|nr:superoxide dismutase [Pararhodonellum marinum]